MADKKVGKVIHYYDKIGVAIIELTDELKVGDKVKFVKGDEAFDQTINSMQIEKTAVTSAKKKQVVGTKVDQPVREGTLVNK